MRPVRHTSHSALVVALVIGMLLTAPSPASGVTIAEIEAELTAVEEAAASASDNALVAEAAAQDARGAAETAAARVAALDAQVAATQVEATAHTARVVAAAVAISRATTDSPLLARVLTAADPETLLAGLSTAERTGRLSAQLARSARESANAAAAQRSQADVVRAERDRLATDAEAAAARARGLVEAETAAIASARSELDALYTQLAAAQRTTVVRAKTQREERIIAQQAAQPAAGAPTSPSRAPETPVTSPPAPAAPPAPVTPAPPPVAPPAGAPIATPAEAQAIARQMSAARGWGDDQFSCLVRLWNRESGWRVQARNPSSGAYGIPQAYPAEKLASAGPDWRTDAATQISWGLSYIGSRYGSPCGAWDHSERTGWY
ncbi:hypothetical protein DEU34_2399 [Microbacterium sp. AG1240]|uniref:aggregation-promoting factor C-terminal-like domain-containing protein n=1 Tax=Microbacterium sp. AG1240 TaxID=2183992 RepID=UPI000F21B6E5|nr:lytic transglycosylase domain-containing protein [Microbacterium sp. AG1240]RKT33794.1 hypothetical protein DEU34_2399 [Microbacterium sp. AG1240]